MSNMTPIRDESFIQTIGYPLKHKHVLDVETAFDGSLKIKPLGLFARIWHWRDSHFHQERLSKLASVIARVISVQNRLSIAEAAESETLKIARNFLKELRIQNITSPAIKQLKREITAAKLGISTSILDRNPGFQEIAERYHLERYFLIYHHTLHVDSNNQQIFILKEGVLKPWRQVFEEIRAFPKFTHAPQLEWMYGSEGIQNKDMYAWTELEPFMKADPADWNHQYVFEFCCCYNPNSLKNGNHSWLRLKTPEGEIYSIGLYRPDKAALYDNLKTPLRIKPGYLMQPDVSEFWDFSISTVDFVISKEIFLKIKQTIEEDKENEDLVFQLFNNNCLLYAKKLALIGGVDLPTSDTALRFMIPPKIFRPISVIMGKLPLVIQKMSVFVTAFFLNLLQIVLGGCQVDKNLNEGQKKRATPHLRSFKDILDVNKSYLNHPNTLAFKIRPKVLDWRKREIEALRQTESDLERRKEKEKVIALSLPPFYYVRPVV